MRHLCNAGSPGLLQPMLSSIHAFRSSQGWRLGMRGGVLQRAHRVHAIPAMPSTTPPLWARDVRHSAAGPGAAAARVAVPMSTVAQPTATNAAPKALSRPVRRAAAL
jgi:hypothetical protein